MKKAHEVREFFNWLITLYNDEFVIDNLIVR